MKPYPEYKDSGIEWIGKIPKHWEIKKLKYCTSINHRTLTEKTPNDYVIQYIDISNVGSDGAISKIQKLKFVDSPSRARRVLKNGDTIISTVRTYLKAIGFINSDDENQIASTGFAVLTPGQNFYPKYLYYIVSNQKIIDTVSSRSVGVSYPSISSSELGSIPVWFPKSIEEQKALFDYIERKIKEIDPIIEKKKKLITLLKEERAVVINQAVTKGLDPNVPMKDSGIEWLGDIPEHWEVKKLKHVCSILGRIGFRGYKSSDLVPKNKGAISLGAKHITKGNKIDLSEPVFISWEKYYESPEIMVKIGDIVFSQRGAYLGKIGIIDSDYGEITINPSLILLKEIKVNVGYFHHYLSCNYIQKNVEMISNSTAIPMISQEQLSNFICLLPPAMEQNSIKVFIEQETTKIDKTISKIEQEIELLKEYRTTLISEVVTGKIDVRGEVIP